MIYILFSYPKYLILILTLTISLNTMSPALDYYTQVERAERAASALQNSAAPTTTNTGNPNVYYNARLDPRNFLEGPLSQNPATRLRQMLARPGIVVSAL